MFDTLNLSFEIYGIEDGLSQSLVTSVIQDEKGYIWVGTKGGLNRFDGNSFKQFKNDDQTPFTLPGDYIVDLFIDKEKRLWVSTQNDGLCYFNPSIEGFIEIFDQDGKRIQEPGRLWSTDSLLVGTSRFHLDKSYVVVVNNLSTEQELPFVGIPFENSFENGSEIINHFLKCLKRSNGKNSYSWYFSSNGMFFSVDSAQRLTVFEPHNGLEPTVHQTVDLSDIFPADQSIKFFENAEPGEVYIDVSGTGIFKWNNRSPNLQLIFPQAATNWNKASKFIDNKNNLWLNFGEGHLEKWDSLQSSQIYRLSSDSRNMSFRFEDKTGNIWLTSGGHGLGKLSVNHIRFARHTIKTTHPCWGLRIEMPEKRAHYSSNVYRAWQNPENKRLAKAKERSKLSRSFFPFTDDENYIWFYSDTVDVGQSLYRYKLYPDEDDNYDSLKTNLTNYNYVLNAIHWQNDSIYLVAKDGDKYSLVKTGSETSVLSVTPFPEVKQIDQERFIQDYLAEYPNRIWFATRQGLMVYNVASEEWKIYNTESGLRSANVLSICKDPELPEKRLWIATSSGLHSLDYSTDSIKSYGIKNGLVNNFVNGILPDNYGNLWLSTNYGLAQFNPRENQFKTFTKFDGLNGNEFNRFQYSKDDQGRLFFGGIEGTTSLGPKDFISDTTHSGVVLGELRIFNEPIGYLAENVGEKFTLQKPFELTEEIVLNYDQSMITVGFGLIDFGDWSKQSYKYRLNGLNDEWIETKNIREATYTNLDPGNYTFEVLGRNSLGNWSQIARTLKIKVLPPWWATWWFRALILVFVVGIFYSLYRYRLNQLLRVERMRNQIAQDLHDEIGSTLSSISLYSAVMKSNEKDLSPKSQPVLDRIITNVSSIMEKMNDMVWTIKSDNDSMEQVVNRMRAFAAEMTEAKGIKLDFNSQSAVERVKLGMDKRKEIYLIFKEAVNNAAKYSEATEMQIRLVVKTGKLILTISDDGKGFDLANPPRRSSGGNGLAGMKRRAERIKGQLEVSSDLQTGTVVNLKVPTNH
ncbi:triple tyrosine motif-containing protein [Cryomorphaceae bacterium 1068]|nr:triple tyrosine motif-containing protein [Cryomorphaceae bacterium 1068]